jgi:hypothetical protein
MLLALTTAAWACICFPRAEAITPADAPPNARITLDLPTDYADQNPVTAWRIDNGPWHFGGDIERRQGERTRVTLRRRNWPKGARILVARSNGTRLQGLLQTRISLPRDTTAPKPEGEISGRLFASGSTCSNGRTALRITVPADPEVVAWGVWTEGRPEPHPDMDDAPWLLRPTNEDGETHLFLGRTACGDDGLDFTPGEIPLTLVPFDAAGNPGPAREERIVARSVWVRG